jgi:hypothetical protein
MVGKLFNLNDHCRTVFSLSDKRKNLCGNKMPTRCNR